MGPTPAPSSTEPPTAEPSQAPTHPTAEPSAAPTHPTAEPSAAPTHPTAEPTAEPTSTTEPPTVEPTSDPTAAPTAAPTPMPFGLPTIDDDTSFGEPTFEPEEFCNTVTETEGGYCGGEKYPVAAGAFCKWTFCPAPATTS